MVYFPRIGEFTFAFFRKSAFAIWLHPFPVMSKKDKAERLSKSESAKSESKAKKKSNTSTKKSKPEKPTKAAKSEKTAKAAKPTRTKTPASAKKAAPKAAAPAISNDDIALRAYFIAERRHKMGWAGNSESDWIEAERQLRQEAQRAARAAKA
jgi:transglutaminase/protease-like cytokinesis protein 3